MAGKWSVCPKKDLHWRMFVIEFLGSFLLGFIVHNVRGGLANLGPEFRFVLLTSSIAIAAAIGVLHALAADITGGHFNPAVSIGMWLGAANKFNFATALLYVFIQSGGAICGMWLDYGLYSQPVVPFEPVPLTPTLPYLVAEMLLTSFIVLVYLSVTLLKTSNSSQGGPGPNSIGMNALLIMMVNMTCFIANGDIGSLFNPALAAGLYCVSGGTGHLFRVESFGIFCFGPFLGSILGVIIFKIVRMEEYDQGSTEGGVMKWVPPCEFRLPEEVNKQVGHAESGGEQEMMGQVDLRTAGDEANLLDAQAQRSSFNGNNPPVAVVSEV